MDRAAGEIGAPFLSGEEREQRALLCGRDKVGKDRKAWDGGYWALEMEKVWIVARWLLGNLRREIIIQGLPLPGWSCIHASDRITTSPWSYMYEQPAHHGGTVGHVLCLESLIWQIELWTKRGKFLPHRARSYPHAGPPMAFGMREHIPRL